jgi:nucleotide-binding universal stress UspA family protein
MQTPRPNDAPPRRILLATDLGARCDRALARAAGLASTWQSALLVLHVVEDRAQETSYPAGLLPSWRRPPDPQGQARSLLLADVEGMAPKPSIVVEAGDPPDVILRRADALACDLIVTGVASYEPLGGIRLGRTVERLLRRSRMPLLIVRDRVRAPYRHVVAASDFSDSSLYALKTAAAWFPEQRLTLFHAYEAPLAGMVPDAASYRSEYGKIAAQECEAFLERSDMPAGMRRPHVLVEYGPPGPLLRDYARERGADLVVLGTQGRSALAGVFLGSIAKQILEHLPCDALVVRSLTADVEA